MRRTNEYRGRIAGELFDSGWEAESGDRYVTACDETGHLSDSGEFTACYFPNERGVAALP